MKHVILLFKKLGFCVVSKKKGSEIISTDSKLKDFF